MAEQKLIVIDGANVAWEEKSEDGKPKLANILAMKKEVEIQGYEAIIIVDASLKYNIDDPRLFEELEDNQTLRQVPSGSDADRFVLEYGARFRVPVVSNDTFRDYEVDYPWIAKDRVKYMIINGKVELEWPARYNGNGNGNGHK